MSDEPFYSPKAKPRPPRVAQPSERRFEFRKGVDHYVCELRDHGEFGIEAQFLLNGELYIARTFRDQPDLNLRAWAVAIAWAEQQRTAMEKDL
jgi:hypothetical protein